MRLTLGTLLAYLDDVLSAEDSEAMKRKLDESEYATRLVHRIRNVMRKLRLGSPALIEAGNSDANATAEYLDSTLPAEKAPEFEKMCLESDVHLAEVASCHQIRAVLLVQPADVPPALREHIYSLGKSQPAPADEAVSQTSAQASAAAESAGMNGAASAAAASEVAASSTAPDTAEPKTQQPEAAKPEPENADAAASSEEKPAPAKQEVPEYLRTGQRTALWPYAAVGVLVFALTGLALLAMGPLNNNHPVAALFGVAPTPPPAEDAAVTPGEQPTTQPNTQPTETQTGADAAPPVPAAGGPPPHAFVGDGAVRQPSTVPGSGAISGPGAAPPAPVPAGQAPPLPTGDAPPLPTGEAPPLPTGEAPPLPTGEAPPLPTGEAPPLPTGEAPPLPTGEAPPLPAGETPVVPPASGDPAPVTKPAPVGKPVGSYVSEKQVVATRSAGTGDWKRLSLNDPVHAGQELLVLPTYRPRFALGDLVLTLHDDTRATINEGDAEGILKLQLHHGRAILNVVGDATPVIQMEAGGIGARAALSGAAASLVVESTLIRRPGVDPVTGVVTAQVDVWCVSGEGILATTEGEFPLKPGQRISFRTGMPAVSGANPAPAWANPETRNNSDSLASSKIEPLIATDKPLLQSLMEIFNSESRLQENRSLAMRSLAAVNHYDFFFTTLTERDQRSYWDRNIAAMRRALARSPKAAELVKSTLQRSPGDTVGDLVYELLVGYSEKQLMSGGSKKLVELLNHESMPVRVLAFNNLYQITGKSFMYFPEREHPQSRIKALRRWQALEEANQIRWAAGASATPPATASPPKPEPASPADAGASSPAPDPAAVPPARPPAP